MSNEEKLRQLKAADKSLPKLIASRRVVLPPIRLTPHRVFRQNVTSLVVSAMAGTEGAVNTRNISTTPGLKKIKPYWYPFCTMAKERWIGREILEVVSTEFRDRSMEFYVRAGAV